MMRRSCQSGLSMPEILVALFSSSLLMSTLISQYVSVKQHYKRSETMLENALDRQLVVDLIRSSIRQAGFAPCLGVEHLSTMDMRPHSSGLKAIKLYSKEYPGFQVNHMSNQYGLLTAQISLTSFSVTKDAVLSSHHPVMIADCYHAEVHSIAHIRSAGEVMEVVLQRPLFYTYQSPIYIGEWIEEGFLIKNDMLFYRLNHMDALSSGVHGVSVSIQSRDDRRLVHVELAIEKNRKIEVDTLMRVA